MVDLIKQTLHHLCKKFREAISSSSETKQTHSNMLLANWICGSAGLFTKGWRAPLQNQSIGFPKLPKRVKFSVYTFIQKNWPLVPQSMNIIFWREFWHMSLEHAFWSNFLHMDVKFDVNSFREDNIVNSLLCTKENAQY